MHSRSRQRERESDTGFLRIYMQWKVRVVSPSFKREADSERSLWQSLEMNTEDEHKVNEYEQEEREKSASELHQSETTTTTITTSPTSTIQTKDCVLQS